MCITTKINVNVDMILLEKYKERFKYLNLNLKIF